MKPTMAVVTPQRGRRTALATRLSVAGAALVLLLTGCSDAVDAVEDAVRDGRPGSFASEARRLPGVRDATVEKTALDTDYWSWDAAVDMAPEATPEQVAGVLDKLAAWAGQQDGEHTTTLTIGAGGARPSDGCWASGPDTVTPALADPAANLRNARLVLAAGDLLDESVCVSRLAWKVFADDPVRTGERILADPRLAAAEGLLIEWGEGWVGPDGPLTRQFLDVFTASLAAAERTPGGRMRINNFAPPGLEVDHPNRRHGVDVGIYLRLPGHEGPAALASPATADPRWPAVRAQLDLLRQLPPGSRLWVALQHDRGCRRCHWDWADDLLLVSNAGSLRVRKPGVWQHAAEAHLAR